MIGKGQMSEEFIGLHDESCEIIEYNNLYFYMRRQAVLKVLYTYDPFHFQHI